MNAPTTMTVAYAAALYLVHIHDGNQPLPATFTEVLTAYKVLTRAGIDAGDRAEVALAAAKWLDEVAR